MNKVILLGRLTRDPETRMSSSNLEICRFSVACNSENVSRNNDNAVEFINCVAFGNTASVISKYMSKGSQISLTGRINNGNYTAQDGTKRYTTDVVVENFEFCGSRGNDNSSSNSYNNSSSSNYSNNSQSSNSNSYNSSPVTVNLDSNSSTDPYKDFGDDITVSGDDLPF